MQLCACVCVCVCMRERMTSLLPLGAGRRKIIMACCHELSEFVDVCEREHHSLCPSPCGVCVRILYGVHKHDLHPQSPSLLAPIKFFLRPSLLSSPSFSLSIHPPFFFFFTQQLAYGDVHRCHIAMEDYIAVGLFISTANESLLFPLFGSDGYLQLARPAEETFNSHTAAWRGPTDSPHAGFFKRVFVSKPQVRNLVLCRLHSSFALPQLLWKLHFFVLSGEGPFKSG